MIEKGELANKVSNRIDDLRDWLMSMDILKLLEGIVDLVKTVSFEMHFDYPTFTRDVSLGVEIQVGIPERKLVRTNSANGLFD